MRIHTLGTPDASGRRRPDPVTETEFSLPCDMVINAISQDVQDQFEGIAVNPNGTLVCDLDTGATAVAGVFAGGDAATGPDTVIAAVASGRKAAASIDAYLTDGEPFLAYDPELTEVSKKQVLARQKGLELEPRVPLPMRPGRERTVDFEPYRPALTEEEAVKEASRCLVCGCGEGCGLCFRICSSFAVERQGNDAFRINEEKCVACGMCFRRCPNQNIEMVQLDGTV
jgi:formate dehydrogenase major subunit